MKKNWLAIVLIVLAVLILGFAAWYYLYEPSTETIAPDENSPARTETPEPLPPDK